MSIYYIIYKTTHINGRYYIGRHQTKNLDDGYLGSGNWVRSIKDKSTLSREIIETVETKDELLQLEQYYIELHWDDPLCMNMSKSSNGFTSEDHIIKLNNGTHHCMRKSDGSSLASKRVEKGTHPWQKKPDGSSFATERVKKGTHNFQTKPDGSNLAKERSKNGTHNFFEVKGKVPCYNKKGEYVRIPKNQYDSQYGPMEDREWVFNCSKEGKRRKLLRE